MGHLNENRVCVDVFVIFRLFTVGSVLAMQSAMLRIMDRSYTYT